MKRTCLLFLSCIFLCSSSAQPTSYLKALRYNEDYAVATDDSISKTYLKLKHIKLVKKPQSYLSIGGDVRYQYIKIANEDWGDTPESSDGYMLARHLVYADLHAGKHWRTFVQLQSSLAAGKQIVSALDTNPLELHQVFIDYEFSVSTKTTSTLRLGRQELVYGSQRLISVREGPNNRQSFDGLKYVIRWPNGKLDLFYTYFVASHRGTFNDRFNDNLKIRGGYISFSKVNVLKNIDFYYIGLRKHQAVFDDGGGTESRHSLGSRIWNSQDKWNYDIEGVYQFGKIPNQKILAWTISFKASYILKTIKLLPEIGLKAELISGDRYYGDNAINTFNPLFPSGAYFGLAALFGPSNLIDIHPSLALTLSEDLTWNCEYQIFWRNSKSDGIYTNHGVLIYSGRNNPYSFIGDQISADLRYTPCPFITLTCDLKYFRAGKFLKKAGTGRDILFASVSIQGTF